MELWDVYDKNGNNTGKTKQSDALWTDDECRLGASLWIVNQKRQLLIQQRSSSKEFGAGLWSVTGGGVQAGETSLKACIREVSEELGLLFCAAQIKPVFRFIGKKMIFDDFVALCNEAAERAVLQKEEVFAIRWESMEQIKDMYLQGQFMYESLADLEIAFDAIGRFLACQTK